MAIMGAITYKSFNDAPEKASRPYDMQREGFVPSHGAAVLILEDLEHAQARGAKIYAEILGVESSSDGCHLPQPSQQGQARLMKRLLKKCGVAPTEVDYVNAHATSTPLGDMTELRSIKGSVWRPCLQTESECAKIDAGAYVLVGCHGRNSGCYLANE
jgi:3-oxoacyl-[acyl-carrier-protein] synthase-1